MASGQRSKLKRKEEYYANKSEAPSSEYIITDGSSGSDGTNYMEASALSIDRNEIPRKDKMRSKNGEIDGKHKHSAAKLARKPSNKNRNYKEKLLDSDGSGTCSPGEDSVFDYDGEIKWGAVFKDIRGALFVLFLIAVPVTLLLRMERFDSKVEALKSAVNEWKINPDQSSIEYGPIANWNVGEVRDMSWLFYAADFNEDISSWDTSSSTSMMNMFSMSVFNQDIGGWDVSKVVNMKGIFASDYNFNQDLSRWDTSSLQHAAEMFQYCSSFNQDLSAWQVSKVESIGAIWQVSSAFAGDISSWDVENVTEMTGAFSESSFNGDVSAWDVTRVVNLSFCFGGTPFNQDLSAWSVYSATSMVGMFSKSSFNHDISSWQVSRVKNMAYMFGKATYFDQDISGWDISSVTKKSGIFYDADSFDCTYDPFYIISDDTISNYSNATQNYTDDTVAEEYSCFDY